MTDLSVIIPSRNELFLKRTIEDILKNIRGDSEIIAVLDGAWAEPQIPDMPRVTLVHFTESIGQRAAVNRAARISEAKYVAKCDAHCAFDEGFDVKLMADMQPDWTVAPTMRNLHIFDWVCEDGHRRYQGPSGPCMAPKKGYEDRNDLADPQEICGKPTKMDIVWIAKTNPQSNSYCFDPEPHFQYFGEYNKRPEGKGDLTETMSLQGSFFMMERERYLKLNICDEAFGSWGSQGLEVSIKSWLSGGKVMINHKTWYAHCFRTQGGDFSFPYPISGKQVSHAKKYAKDLFFNNKWEKQIYPLSWLVEKFWPIPGWKDEDLAKVKAADGRFSTVVEPIPSIEKPLYDLLKEYPENAVTQLTKGIVWYTDNRLDPTIMRACQEQLRRSADGSRIVSVSLQPIEFGENIVLPLERGYLTLFKQILAGLEASTADIIFFAEHDVLYAPEYFSFTPPDRAKVYYNLNVWQVRTADGHAVYYDAKRTSQLCAYRDVLVEHYRKRVERVEKEGFTRRIGFEPGSHHRPERIDDLESDTWVAKYPNLDLKHGQNLTPTRWSTSEFRSQRNCRNWKEADEVPYWGITGGRFNEILESINGGLS